MMLKTTRYKFLLQQHRNRIYSYSFYMLRNKMDADDVTQEVMIRLWNNIDGFKINVAKTWIMKTTHNLCIDYLRKRKRSVTRETCIDDFMEDTISDNVEINNPYIKTHIKMMTSKVKEAIQKLPENLRSVFVLYELEGMKYKEISSALNISLNGVKVNLLRARKKLQEELKTYKPREVI
jgi:RNA polymerase sigma-70 factor (ECF subfamily)